MSSNWAYNLDLLAQNGVLDFDGAAFVTGQAPRYVGRPATPPSPYVGQVPPAPALNQPKVDEFQQQKTKLPKQENKEDSMIHNPSWKKIAFGVLALGGLIFVGFKAKSIGKWIKGLFKGEPFKNFKWQKVGDFFKKVGTSIKNFFVKGWEKVKGIFSKKTSKP
jgi:hypothetical protein